MVNTLHHHIFHVAAVMLTIFGKVWHLNLFHSCYSYHRYTLTN
jgi:membrane protein YdbS with pleckstrin-like domain